MGRGDWGIPSFSLHNARETRMLAPRMILSPAVIQAKAGIHRQYEAWIPAFAPLPSGEIRLAKRTRSQTLPIRRPGESRGPVTLTTGALLTAAIAHPGKHRYRRIRLLPPLTAAACRARHCPCGSRPAIFTATLLPSGESMNTVIDGLAPWSFSVAGSSSTRSEPSASRTISVPLPSAVCLIKNSFPLT